MNNNKTLIATLRRAKGWTQEFLAEKSGLSVRTIQRLESGDDTSLDTLRLVAEALDVSVSELFEKVENKDKEKEIEQFSEERTYQLNKRHADNNLFRIWKSAFFVLMLIVAAFISSVSGTKQVIFGTVWLALFLLGFAVLKYIKSSWWNSKLDVKYPLTRGVHHTKAKNSDDFLWWKNDIARPVMLILYGAVIPLLFILKYGLHVF